MSSLLWKIKLYVLEKLFDYCVNKFKDGNLKFVVTSFCLNQILNSSLTQNMNNSRWLLTLQCLGNLIKSYSVDKYVENK